MQIAPIVINHCSRSYSHKTDKSINSMVIFELSNNFTKARGDNSQLEKKML